MFIYSKNGKIDNKLRPKLIESLMKMLNHFNPLVKAFRSYKDRYQNSDIEDTVRMVLIAKRDKDARTHNLPTATEVAALIPGDFEEGLDNRDIMLEAKDGSLRRISELYVGYLALKYPLLFPYAEDGYQVGIEDGFSHKEDRKRKTISMREYYSYRIQDRLMESQAIIRSKRLYQQFLVDVFTMIEANRLRYFRNNQVKLRSEKFVNLVEAHNEGQSDLSNTGKRILIPASFTGGSRYMNNNYLDAMAICKYFGFPDLFITFTCNPNRPEIVRYCQKRNLKPEDRPDICCRIFKMKLESLMTDLTEKSCLVKLFVKRGLPHAHILIWMASKYKFPTPESIDKVISAEIPNKETDPELYEVVKQNMIHGPCEHISMLSGVHKLGQSSIYSNTSTKGPDRVLATIENNAKDIGEFANEDGDDASEVTKDEIREYFECRYVSACEASWRILAFAIHYRSLPVEKLYFHLPGEQPCMYGDDDPVETVLNRRSVQSSMLLAFFEACNKYPELSKNLTYAEFPIVFIYDIKEVEWRPRQKGMAIGRLTYVPLSCGQLYYLRVLLNMVQCPTSFDFLKTVDKVLYPTFKDACYALGLLDDDTEYIEALKEASIWGSGSFLRKLFAVMLITDSILNPCGVWNETWQLLSDDIIYRRRRLENREGKTHLWKILSAAIRSKGQIVLNVASSGIAALLLPGGRTAHSRFGIPLNPDELSTCNMHPGSDLAALVAEASLIIWDEAPMMSKFCFESLDWSIRDVIPRHKDKPFGGKVVVFGGDFRQVLPVITGGGREDITRASLCSSYLWDECKVLKLTKNMRLLADIDASVAEEIKSFSEWILRVGDGKVSLLNTGEVMIDMPEELLITECNEPIKAIVESVYGLGFEDQTDPNFFQEREILCPTNDDVCAINDYMMSALRGEERVYLSSDSIDPSDTSNHDSSVYTPDFLNNIKISGLPNHCIKLRVGSPVMLLRNIDPNSGLCNGTRLQVTQLADHIIEAIVLTGHTLGQKVYTPRLSVSPPEGKFPFRMRRRQFPLIVSFAMTINKSQEQTLSSVSLYLPRPVFSHGQLYVALSRVKSKAGLKVLIVDKEGNPQKQTMNVVFKEIFQKLIK
ncbi:uncharacterized protein LOC112088047 [Eutrema salsugineum]|uniref:uncharacterized protein LOC112088047 n=1 Tax=Eutrema salsugineum TaxID=72664 RepID=UPI000CED3BEA|nr:uncharacterized protein LOC112088047 [Eutrema salsugineum]